MVDLLPCPFCASDGATLYHHQIEGWEDSWHVECIAEDCGCGTCHHETEEEAIATWNRRA